MHRMSEAKYEAIIGKQLEDLIPAFMESRRKELGALEAAFASGGLGEIDALALKMKGYGSSYGFDRIAALAEDLREAASRDDHEAVAAYLHLYREYLEQVRITFA
jgi:HPt (histidine-containing phosphotransfer) domain-containing protein